MTISPVGLEDSFDEEVEHVGILRSTSGNLPKLLNRISARKRALGAVLYTGMANENPAASLKIDMLYPSYIVRNWVSVPQED